MEENAQRQRGEIRCRERKTEIKNAEWRVAPGVSVETERVRKRERQRETGREGERQTEGKRESERERE